MRRPNPFLRARYDIALLMCSSAALSGLGCPHALGTGPSNTLMWCHHSTDSAEAALQNSLGLWHSCIVAGGRQTLGA